MVVSREHRIWSVPLGFLCTYYYTLNEKIYKKIPGIGDKFDAFLPDRATQLIDIGELAIKGVLGQNELTEFSALEFMDAEAERKARK